MNDAQVDAARAATESADVRRIWEDQVKAMEGTDEEVEAALTALFPKWTSNAVWNDKEMELGWLYDAFDNENYTEFCNRNIHPSREWRGSEYLTFETFQKLMDNLQPEGDAPISTEWCARVLVQRPLGEVESQWIYDAAAKEGIRLRRANGVIVGPTPPTSETLTYKSINRCSERIRALCQGVLVRPAYLEDHPIEACRSVRWPKVKNIYQNITSAAGWVDLKTSSRIAYEPSVRGNCTVVYRFNFSVYRVTTDVLIRTRVVLRRGEESIELKVGEQCRGCNSLFADEIRMHVPITVDIAGPDDPAAGRLKSWNKPAELMVQLRVEKGEVDLFRTTTYNFGFKDGSTNPSVSTHDTFQCPMIGIETLAHC